MTHKDKFGTWIVSEEQVKEFTEHAIDFQSLFDACLTQPTKKPKPTRTLKKPHESKPKSRFARFASREIEIDLGQFFKK
jgi:hypothetical protein